MTRLQPHWDEEVPCAFRSGAGQIRRLDVEKAVALHDAPDDRHDLRARAQRPRGTRAAQVEVAVAPTRDFVDTRLDGVRAGDRERRSLRLAQHLDVRCHHLDVAGGQVGVLVAGAALQHRAGDLDTPLATQIVCGLDVTEDDLHESAAVAQIDEGDATVVATRRNPAGEDDIAPVVLAAQCPCAVGPHHFCNLFSMCSTSSSMATGSCSALAMSLTCTTPSARSRSPATSVSRAPDRSAAFIAPFSPRSPYAMSAPMPRRRSASTTDSNRRFASAPSGTA